VSGENRLDSLKQKGVVTVCQAPQHILKASEQVLNPDTSRRCQLRSVVRTLLCACVVVLVPNASVFAQAPYMERRGHDAQFGPDRPGAIFPNPGNDEMRLEPAHSVGNRLPASESVTLHELSHHVPSRAVKEFERALKAANEGEKENAIAHYHKAIAADPEFLLAINNLGVTYLGLNRVEVAIEQFTKAIAVDPHAALPQVNLAIAYLRLELFGDAERAARRAVDLDRVDKYGRLVLGISSIMKGDFTAEAERSLTQAAQEYTIAKVWLAIGLSARGDIANARDYLRTYVAEMGNAASNVAIKLLQKIESAGQSK
jgi:tetratricopeptide (TPR) repeat protein